MNIKQIKEKFTCLDYLGESRIVKKLSGGYLCRAPWREDAHPSLSVTHDGKGWQDHSDGTHGNLIDMIARTIGSNDFARICAEFDKALSSCKTVKTFDGSKEERTGFAWFNMVPLAQWQLKQYLLQRGVDPQLAQSFGVQEAHYSFNASKPRGLFSLAYPNNKGGCELRSALFKGSKSPKGITTHILRENAPYVVFEGFFDMLSFDAMMKEQGKERLHNYLVLNSVVNVEEAIEALKNAEAQIYLCLDNDKAGTDTTLKIQKSFPKAQDIRHKFLPYVDVNDYRMNTMVSDYTSNV